jgi:hypothetical protein
MQVMRCLPLAALIASALPLAALAQRGAEQDLDVTAAVSTPAPPQPVPLAPATPLHPPGQGVANAQAGTQDIQPSQPSAALDPTSSQGLIAPPSPDRSADRISLSAKSRFMAQQARMGDTLEYRIEVTWQDSRVPVLVLAPDSVDFSGLTLVDQSTHHEKSAMAGKVENRTVFSYTLLPQQVGMAKAASLKVRYTSALSGLEEAVFAPSAQVEVLPARFAFLRSTGFIAACAVLALGLAAFGAFLALKSGVFGSGKGKKASEAKPADKRAQLEREVLSVKSRIGHGESREILAEMEKLAVLHLSATVSAEAAAQAHARFDALLDAWLAGNRDDLDRTADWERLRELFRQARYAGGHKEPHELQDAWRAMKRCLNVVEES